MPILSIITINLNNKKGLQKTIASVVNQTYKEFAYIIIDGGSTDGSVDLIKQNADRIAFWVSEPDNGIYNAMNKGINKANSEYCLFLNSGDCLINAKVIEQIHLAEPIEDILYGNMYFDNFLQTYPHQLSLSFFINKSLGHASTIIKTQLFKKYGYFDETLKIVADWEFFFRSIQMKGASYRYLNDLAIARFNMDGISANYKNLNMHYLERKTVLIKYLTELCQIPQNREIIAEAISKLSFYENSKLIQLAKRTDNSRIINLIKRLYHAL
jgi:glycosyltransferase involved in cell wall biosynthesis